MKTVKVSAPGRVDLVAGPTDWCGGNTLSMAINLRARVEARLLKDKDLIVIEIDGKREEYYEPFYDGEMDLFKAVIELSKMKGFEIKYSTEIPKGSGLGGSAPLTVSTVMAITRLFNLNWSKYYMTELAQRAETYKLHTVNGYQDQYSAMFGGLLFMNFEGKKCQRGDYSKTIEEEPYATIEQLTPYAPDFNLVVAIPDITRSGSGQTNGSLSDRYLDGEKKIVDLISKMSGNGREAKKTVVDNDIDRLYKLINEDNEILREFGFLSEDNEKIIEVAMKYGAIACRTCGAGRGAVAIFSKNEIDRETIYQALKNESIVKHLFKSEMDTGATYE